MIKAFFTAAQIFAVLNQFGELSDEISNKMAYAKWKAVEIDRCMKNGIVPTPGPPGGEGKEDATEWDPQDPSSEPQNDAPQPANIAPPGVHPQSYLPDSSPYPPGPSPYSFGSSPYPPGPSLYPPAPSHPSESPGPSSDSAVKPIPAPRRSGPGSSPQAASKTHPTSSDPAPSPSGSGGGVTLTRAQTSTVQKYCKFASSALDYDDYGVAIDYLEKSLRLLRTGKE